MTGPTTNEELLAKLDAEENPVTCGVLKDICVRRLRESVEIQRELCEALESLLTQTDAPTHYPMECEMAERALAKARGRS